MPQGSAAPAWGGVVGAPIPRYAREEELPGEEAPARSGDTAPGRPAGRSVGPPPAAKPPKAAGGTRQKLKDYLDKVREKLEAPLPGANAAAPDSGPPEAMPAAPSAEGPLALLEELGEYLPKREPERRKNVFMRSDARMKLDYLKSRLEGHKGIRQRIEQDYSPDSSTGSVSLQKVADAFIFIKELAGHYPDPSVGTMMQSKVDSILRRIKR
jgi:hypothetical protein